MSSNSVHHSPDALIVGVNSQPNIDAYSKYNIGDFVQHLADRLI